MHTVTTKQKWIAFFFLVLAQFMLILDATIVNVALPSIQQAFHLDIESLQWIVTAYTLLFGGFLLLGGRTADLFGRKKVFLIGLSGFTLSSFLIGILNSGFLIFPLRALQGLSAAFVSPAALSMILTMFQEQQQRTKALSIWGGVAAAGGSLGLVLGGILTQFLDWRWNFFVNVPIGIAVFVGAFLLLPPHSGEEHTKKLDMSGATLVTSALLLLVYTITNANNWGWGSLHTIGFLLLSLILLGGFVLNEKRVTHPLMPLSIFTVGNVAPANVVYLIFATTALPVFFFLTLYNQGLNHYTPFESGLAVLPSGLLIGLMAVLAPRFIKSFGVKKVLMFAPLPVALGLFLLTALPLPLHFVTNELPGILIWPLGLGLTFVSIIVAATMGVPPQESGLVSGMITTFQQVGASIGLAILSTVASAQTAHILSYSPHTQKAIAQASLAGFHSAFFVAALYALASSLVSFLFIRQIRKSSSTLSQNTNIA